MRNQFAFLFSFLLVLASCSNEPNEEVNANAIWQTGKFYYTDSLFGKFLIKRYDSIQLEYLKMHQLEVQFRMNWLNDSMYELTFDQVNNNPKEISLPHDLDSLVKTCTITEISDTSYVEKATSNLNDEIILTTVYLATRGNN
ncbi:MAG: hypothetical protein KJP21_09170 [Bacteroidia bacterium]|nr:hypothetical protein [Bacteroidia bacterium]NNJ55540.1 hypothetical protein [Bacteroidia bacterium]